MTGVQYGINAGFEQFVADGLGTVFDGYSDLITLDIDNPFRFVIMAILRVL